MEGLEGEGRKGVPRAVAKAVGRALENGNRCWKGRWGLSAVGMEHSRISQPAGEGVGGGLALQPLMQSCSLQETLHWLLQTSDPVVASAFRDACCTGVVINHVKSVAQRYHTCAVVCHTACTVCVCSTQQQRSNL